MAINIKGAVAQGSPHGEAAVKMGDPTPQPDTPETTAQTDAQPDLPLEQEHVEPTMSVTTTTEKEEAVVAQSQDMVKGELVSVPANYAKVKIGLSFKFPVADYTMIGFEVGVEYPCDPDEVDAAFDASKEWAEGKLNQLIEAQQSEV